MTVKEYTEDCVQFAKDSENWLNNYLYDAQFVTTTGNGWVESSDNAIGGFSVLWAFHKDEKFIRENAAQEYVNEIKDLMQLIIDDEECTADKVQWILNMLN